MVTPHPAKYTDSLLPVMARMLAGCSSVLDVMAGTGKLHKLRDHGFAGRCFLNEIQPNWAIQGLYTHTRVVVGNALYLPFPDGSFPAICTSPCYGNRCSDHHKAKDKSRRHTYRHCYGKDLHPDNSGTLPWGKKYRAFHEKAWIEVWRVLKSGGKFVLNIKNHIRKGKVQYVSEWHKETLEKIGFQLIEHARNVETPNLAHGENWDVRVEGEDIYCFQKP